VAAHAAARRALAAKRQQRAQGQLQQAETAALKRWEYTGSKPGTLWLLGEAPLRRACDDRGLPTDGGRVELIKRLGAHLRQLDCGRLLTMGAGQGQGGQAGGGGGEFGGGGGGGADEAAAAAAALEDLADASDDEMPSNMNALSAEQLAAVCACYGVRVEEGAAKDDMIGSLERGRFQGEQALMLTDGGAGRRQQTRLLKGAAAADEGGGGGAKAKAGKAVGGGAKGKGKGKAAGAVVEVSSGSDDEYVGSNDSDDDKPLRALVGKN
jgi:hypothetical protein